MRNKATKMSIVRIVAPRNSALIQYSPPMSRIRVAVVFAPGCARDGERASWVADTSASELALLREALRNRRVVHTELFGQRYQVIIESLESAKGCQLSRHKLAPLIRIPQA